MISKANTGVQRQASSSSAADCPAPLEGDGDEQADGELSRT
jgi:hypothetical protein